MLTNFFKENYNLLTLITLLLLGVAIYSNTFSATFHFDDYYYILENEVIRNIGNLRNLWNFWPSRFITFFSFAVNYYFHRFDVFGYHLINLIIHLCLSILVWWFINLTFSTPTMKNVKLSLRSNIIALFGALIFLSHPIQTEAVTYIYQRSTSLAAFFYLLSISLYVKSRLLQLAGNRIFGWRILYLFSWVFAVFGMFTKENTITLPFLLILYEISFLKTERCIKWINIIPFLLLIAVLPLLFFIKNSPNSSDIQQLLRYPVTASYYLLTQIRVIVTYIRIIFIPLSQNLDYNYIPVKTLTELPALISFFLLDIILAIAILLFRRHRLISFGIFWFFLTLLPESSIIPLRDLIFEHRLYLPMVGYSCFMASGLFYLFHGKEDKVVIAIFSLLIIFYSILTYQRNKTWKNELTLWSDVVNKSPGKARPYVYLCSTYVENGNNEEAIGLCKKAIQINPAFPRVYYNLGNAYANMGKNEEAIQAFQKEIAISPNFLEAYNNLAASYAAIGKIDEAITLWNKIVLTQPNFIFAHFNLAVFYFKKKQYDLAINHCDRVGELGGRVDPEFLRLLQPYRN